MGRWDLVMVFSGREGGCLQEERHERRGGRRRDREEIGCLQEEQPVPTLHRFSQDPIGADLV